MIIFLNKDELKQVDWMFTSFPTRIAFVNNHRSKTLSFDSLNANDIGVFKCQSKQIIQRKNDFQNEIVIEIKRKNNLYLINWYSSSSPEINLDLSSASDYFSSQLNPYIRDYNTDLNIECLDSLGEMVFNFLFKKATTATTTKITHLIFF